MDGAGIDNLDGAGVNNTTRTIIHAATVKLPPFFPSAPQFWFAQAESQFRIKKIEVDLTKFDHVMASLTEDMALHVMPAIAGQSYAALKDALMEAFDLTASQRATKLLHLPGLGDKRPSTLISEIIALVPKGVMPGYLERQIFIEQLPTSVQQNLAAHDEVTNLRALAKLPDGYVVAARAKMASSTAVVHQPSLPPTTIQESVEDPSSCAAVGGQRVPTGKKLCWNHARFGEKANQCAGNGSEWKRCQGNANAGRR